MLKSSEIYWEVMYVWAAVPPLEGQIALSVPVLVHALHQACTLQICRVRLCCSGGGYERVDVIGVRCYSSTDLANWQDEGEQGSSRFITVLTSQSET
jgi:hypothetical protein